MAFAGKVHKFYSCRDLGWNCDFMVRDETEEEIMKVVADHSCRRHHLCSLSPELRVKIESNIKYVRL